MNEIPPTSGVPPVATPTPPPKKLFGKKLSLLIGLIAVVTVFSALALSYHVPKSLGAEVSLGINYSVGEKMIYDFVITISAMGQTVSQQGAISMEVLSFDGANYTIRYTLQFDSQTLSYTVKMNKTGYIIESSGLPPELQQTYSTLSNMPGFGAYFPRTSARVGESWQIPIDIQEGGYSLDGIVIYGISEIANITTQAGTYTAFRMNIWAINMHGTYQSSGTTVAMTLSMGAYCYMENATCLPIELNIQASASASVGGLSMSMSMGIQMQLKEHTK